MSIIQSLIVNTTTTLGQRSGPLDSPAQVMEPRVSSVIAFPLTAARRVAAADVSTPEQPSTHAQAIKLAGLAIDTLEILLQEIGSRDYAGVDREVRQQFAAETSRLLGQVQAARAELAQIATGIRAG